MAAKSYRYPPNYQVPPGRTEIILEVLSILGIVLSLFAVYYFWPQIPARIPTHFGPSGLPDGWGGKGSLFILAGSAVFSYLLITLTARFPNLFNYPWTINGENADRQYRIARSLMYWLKTEIVWLMLYIIWGTIQVALGGAKGLGTLFLPIFMAVITGTIIIYFTLAAKARR